MGYPDPAMATTPFLLPGPVSKPQQDWHLIWPVFLCLCCVDEQPIFLLESSCRTNWPFDIFRLLWLLGQTHRKLCFKVYFNSHCFLEKIPPSLESDIASKLHVFPWKTLKKNTISCCWTGKASLPRRRPAAAGHLSSAPTSRRPGELRVCQKTTIILRWCHGDFMGFNI